MKSPLRSVLLMSSVAAILSACPVAQAQLPAIVEADNISFGPESNARFDIGGLTPGTQHDQVRVTNSVSWVNGARLSLFTIFGYVPNPEERFTLFTFGSRSGQPTLVPDARYPGLRWSLNFTSNSLTVVTGAYPGDANYDNTVNFSDLLPVARNYLAGGRRWRDGDFTLDGVVNFADLLVLARNYNTSVPAMPAVEGRFDPAFAADWQLAQSLVPEPLVGGTLMAAAALLTRARRGRLA